MSSNTLCCLGLVNVTFSYSVWSTRLSQPLLPISSTSVNGRPTIHQKTKTMTAVLSKKNRPKPTHSINSGTATTLLITIQKTVLSDSSLDDLLRSRCMISSSYQFLPLFPVFNYSFWVPHTSSHQIAQQVHSFPTSCSLLSFFPWLYHAVMIHVLAHALTTRLHFPTMSNTVYSNCPWVVSFYS